MTWLQERPRLLLDRLRPQRPYVQLSVLYIFGKLDTAVSSHSISKMPLAGTHPDWAARITRRGMMDGRHYNCSPTLTLAHFRKRMEKVHHIHQDLRSGSGHCPSSCFDQGGEGYEILRPSFGVDLISNLGLPLHEGPSPQVYCDKIGLPFDSACHQTNYLSFMIQTSLASPPLCAARKISLPSCPTVSFDFCLNYEV